MEKKVEEALAKAKELERKNIDGEEELKKEDEEFKEETEELKKMLEPVKKIEGKNK